MWPILFAPMCYAHLPRAPLRVPHPLTHSALPANQNRARDYIYAIPLTPRARPFPNYRDPVPRTLVSRAAGTSVVISFTPHLVRRSLPGPCGCPVTSIRYASSSLHPSPIQKSLRLHSRPRFRFTLPMRWLRPFIAYPHPSLLSPYSLAIIPRARAFRCRLPHEYRRPQARRVATL